MTKRVLLITMGETPQIVTETVYALLTQNPPWIPYRIILATTGSGKEIFENGLTIDRDGDPLIPVLLPLIGEKGQLARLYRYLGQIANLCALEIEPVRGKDGNPLHDVRTEAEVNAFAETVMTIVRNITNDPDSELHLSIAGGRKTMGGIATQVLSIFGRRQDKLSHCLVEPKNLEWDRTFWWPGSNPEIDTNGAQILLHESPYVRIRASISETEALNNDRLTFAQIVEKANNGLSADKIEIDFSTKMIRIGNAAFPPHTQRKASSVLALILVAKKLGWSARKGKSKYPKQYYVRETKEDFERILLVCYGFLSDYKEAIADSEKGGKFGSYNPGFEAFLDDLKEATIGLEDRKAQAMDGDSFYVGSSLCRTWLLEKLGPTLSRKVLFGAKDGIGTAYTADQISIILPPGFTMDVFDRTLN
jgi:CRISPR-associated protein (TIGR02584 family)